MSAPPVALGALLKSTTAELHRRVERGAYMTRLLRGQLDRAAYGALLHNLHTVYTALEQALSAHATTPAVGPVVMPELFRSHALAADLQALQVPPQPPARAARHYAEHLAKLGTTRPPLLVAHAYVRYLGDLNGGQVLRRVVARSLGLAGDSGASFYDFGNSSARLRLEQRFRDGLERAAAQQPDLQALAAEALDAFARHEALFDELAAA